MLDGFWGDTKRVRDWKNTKRKAGLVHTHVDVARSP